MKYEDDDPTIEEVYTCYPDYEFETIYVFDDGCTILCDEKSVILQSVGGNKKRLSYKSREYTTNPYGGAIEEYRGKQTNVDREEFEELLHTYDWDEYITEDEDY